MWINVNVEASPSISVPGKVGGNGSNKGKNKKEKAEPTYTLTPYQKATTKAAWRPNQMERSVAQKQPGAKGRLAKLKVFEL